MRYQYTTWIPSLQRDIFISEFTTKQQKELLKSINSTYNFEFVQNINTLLQEVILDPAINISSLTLIDKFLILLKLRAVSVSDNIEFKFKCEKCNKEVKAKIGLAPIINTINHLGYPFAFSELEKNFIVNCDLPTVATEVIFEESNVSQFDFLAADNVTLYNEIQRLDFTFFIKELMFTGNEVKVVDLTQVPLDVRWELINKLPARLLLNVWEKIQNVKKQLSIPLINVTCICGAKLAETFLSLNTPAYSMFLKSLFNESPHVIYQNIYYMSSVLKFTPDYIESMTPGERDMFWALYNKDQKERQLNKDTENTEIPVDKQE